MLDVITIGDSTHDTFLMMRDEDARVYCQINQESCEIRLNYADKIPVAERHESVGGNAANAAVSAARLGLQTAIYTEVGDDHIAEMVIAALQQSGVSSDYIVRNQGSETTANVVLSVSGERTILLYHQPRHYKLPQLAPARWVYLTSMKDGYETILPALQAYVTAHNVQLCFQPGSYQLKNPSATQTLLQQTALLVMNKDEAQRYLNRPEEESVLELLKGLRTLGPHTVVITDGKKGAYAQSQNETLWLGTIEGIPRKETTGAGDAFTSGVMSGLAQGKSLGEAMRWGLLQASSVIQQVGAQAGLATKTQLEELAAQYPEPQPQPYNEPK